MGRPASDISERLLEAARRHFLANGVDGASLRKIAADAGTSIGMIHYHYKSKDALFLAVVESFYEGLVKDLAEALDPDRDVESRLRGIFARIGALTDRELEVVILLIREMLVSNERLESVIARFQRGHLPLLIATVVEGRANGTLDEGVRPFTSLLSVVSLALFSQVMSRRLPAEALPFELPGRAELAEELAAILLDGIRAQKQD